MTKVEPKIEPNSILDYFRRKSISFVHVGFIHPGIVADGQLSWQYPMVDYHPTRHWGSTENPLIHGVIHEGNLIFCCVKLKL
jgi:hypothetical protein